MNTGIINALAACEYARSRTLIKTVAGATVPEQLTLRAVSSITNVAGIATVTTAVAHHYQAGDYVTIAGAAEAGFNRKEKVRTVPSATTFTIDVPAGTPPAATGTITALADIFFRQATFFGRNAVRTANTGTVYLGDTSANDTQPVTILADGELAWAAATGAKLNLADLYCDVVTAADGVVVIFH